MPRMPPWSTVWPGGLADEAHGQHPQRDHLYLPVDAGDAGAVVRRRADRAGHMGAVPEVVQAADAAIFVMSHWLAHIGWLGVAVVWTSKSGPE